MNGEGNQALNAPKLAGLPAWYVGRQVRHFKTGIRGGAPGDDIGKQMSAIAQSLDAATLGDVAAYVATLPDVPTTTTVHGDARAGAGSYTTCAYCHGARGQGSWSTNAPPLAGRSDWYLARQLQQFRDGHRGRHPQDYHGSQMARMSGVVPDGEPTADLLAYINSLR
jgi:cytochrome c oxidase subunit 2